MKVGQQKQNGLRGNRLSNAGFIEIINDQAENKIRRREVWTQKNSLQKKFWKKIVDETIDFLIEADSKELHAHQPRRPETSSLASAPGHLRQLQGPQLARGQLHSPGRGAHIPGHGDHPGRGDSPGRGDNHSTGRGDQPGLGDSPGRGDNPGHEDSHAPGRGETPWPWSPSTGRGTHPSTCPRSPPARQSPSTWPRSYCHWLSGQNR